MNVPPAPPRDRVYPATRVLAVVILPFLAAAVIILFLFPGETGQRFAWPVAPPINAMLLAGAYAGGIYFFASVLVARRWSTVMAGFLPVCIFAGLVGIATILHWDKFNHQHIAFILWTILYFTTPFLVFAVWLANRRETPTAAARASSDGHGAKTAYLDLGAAGIAITGGDTVIPGPWRVFFAVQALATLGLGLFLFLFPGVAIPVWPWRLTPLTARVLGAMFTLPGVLGLEITLDPRWETARRLLEAQCVSFLLILVTFLRARGDFNVPGPTYTAFLFMTLLILAALVTLFLKMRRLYN